MRARILSTYLLLSTALAGGLHAQSHDTVWVWNRQCASPTVIAIRLRLDRTVVYEDSLRLCRWERQFEADRREFTFKSPRPLVWRGYRDTTDTTPANTTFTILVWQAGGETDIVVMGLAADAPDGRHMNTLVPVSPSSTSTATIAPGLVLETWPKRPSRPSR